MDNLCEWRERAERAEEIVSFHAELFSLLTKADMFHDLIWSVENDVISFEIICSDTFWWATADGEPIEPTNIEVLRQAIEDCRDHEYLSGTLFASRMRKMRPMDAYYKEAIPEAMWLLFNECGPERTKDDGNCGRRIN